MGDYKMKNYQVLMKLNSRITIYLRFLLAAVSRFDGGFTRSQVRRTREKMPKRNFQKSFSQFGEDALLSFFLPESTGSYLDVGAGDPISGSNTYSLYLKGWRGILIEPLREKVVKLKKKRRGDIVFENAISSREEVLEFYEYAQYEFSTTEKDNYEILSERGIFPKETYNVQGISINSLNLTVQPHEPFLFSLDCEGKDIDIIQGINFEKFLPRVICCEVWPADSKGRESLVSFLDTKGYRLVGILFLSLVFCHQEYISKREWSYLFGV
jgi:FkbM family methyltransferase